MFRDRSGQDSLAIPIKKKTIPEKIEELKCINIIK